MNRNDLERAEVERRLRRVSQLRNATLILRRGALEQWRRGTNPIRPRNDERSDRDFWIALVETRS